MAYDDQVASGLTDFRSFELAFCGANPVARLAT